MPAPIIPAVDPAKVAALEGVIVPTVAEICSIGWQGGNFWEHYSNVPWDKYYTGLAAYNLTPINVRFERGNWFSEITRTSDLADDSTRLIFQDFDGHMIQQYQLYGGEGTHCIIMQYFVDVDLLVSIFWGMLRVPKETNGYRLEIECANGFRSPNLTVPRRPIYPGCSAIFGGLINPYTNTPWFNNQALINQNDCPYSVHLGAPQLSNPSASGFGKINSATGQPFTDCPRAHPADCITRLGDSLSYFGFDVIVQTETIGTQYNQFMATTAGNESALKTPVRVVYGKVRVPDIILLAYEAQSGGKSPQDGFLRCLFVVGEGPVWGCGQHPYLDQPLVSSDPNDPQDDGNPGPSTVNLDSSIRVNQGVITCDHMDWSGFWGTKRQPRPHSSQEFPPGGGLPGQLNYSATSMINCDYGRADFRNFNPDDIKASALVWGKKDVKVYNTPTDNPVPRKWTTSRAWILFDLLTSNRYGMGIDPSRFNIQEWIDLDTWCKETVQGYDESSALVNFQRSTFNGVCDGHPAQNIIGDLCMMGRFSPPFQFEGKLHVIPLREDQFVETVPQFYDWDWDVTGISKPTRILFTGSGTNKQSTLTYSYQSDADLVNQIKFTFNDERYDWAEHPLVVANQTAQLAAGRAFGDLSFRVVDKSYSGFGITNLFEASRISQMLLDFGEFDSGGLKNNFSIKFRIWSLTAKMLQLHPYQVIKVNSARINRFNESRVSGSYGYGPTVPPFAADAYQWFRITKLVRASDQTMEITAQLYPQALQDYIAIPGAGGKPNPGGTSPGTTSPGDTPVITGGDDNGGTSLPPGKDGGIIQLVRTDGDALLRRRT
jgi:hypothetical protein